MVHALPALLVQLESTEGLGTPPAKNVTKVHIPRLAPAAVPAVTVDSTRMPPVSRPVRPVQQATSVTPTGRG
jgi:hypothetical protein